MREYQVTDWCHSQAERYIRKGDLCIDATMGNGMTPSFSAGQWERRGGCWLLIFSRSLWSAQKNVSGKNLISVIMS